MDNISVFKGISPIPAGVATWQQALENIKSDKYKTLIAQGRTIRDDEVKYRKFKTKLPAITFGGTFKKRRNCNNIDLPTGFIIPDLDHLKDVEMVFSLLSQDLNIWFIFRSPSGDGIKAGFRTHGIKNDDDHKKFYFSVEHYFNEIYGIEIDSACKDIARLTFVSCDPDLWINPEPQFFDIQRWEKEIIPPAPVDLSNFRHTAGKEKYALKVLESCCDEITNSQPGNQHHTRLKVARLIGGYLQYISEGDVLSALEQAVIASGVKMLTPAMKTITDGLEYGKLSPLAIEDYSKAEDKRYDDERKVSVSDDILGDRGDKTGKRVTEVTKHDREVTVEAKKVTVGSKKVTEVTVEDTVGTQNLANDIHSFLRAARGSFTIEGLDKELGIKTRRHRQRRSNIINKYLKKEYKKNTDINLKRDPHRNNIYHVVQTEMDWIDIEEETQENFPIILPFELDKKISIPPKSIIVIAGTTNSAKTALILNTLRLNLNSSFEKLFLVSEGAGEIKGRIKSFGDSISTWKDNIMIASQSDNFEVAIENYNTDGLSCIDYLEPTDGQYYLLTNQIRTIYDSLKTGVAMIALQKKSSEVMGRGGEGTAEKARLYMTVDYLCTSERGIICSLSLTKVKQSIDESMQGRELHFKIERGSTLTPLTDWMLSSRVNRQACIVDYENQDIDKSYKKLEEGDFIFRIMNGNNKTKMVRIKRELAQEWAENMTSINVYERLERMSADSMKKLFLNKGYLWQIAGTLDKENKNA